MAKKNRQQRVSTEPTPFEEARDELFQHIMRCGVVGSDPEDQRVWFDETVSYLSERFPELGENQIGELRKLGERFAVPPRNQPDSASAA